MRSFESSLRSLDVYEAHVDHRLRGRRLSKAKGEGYSLLVAYDKRALAFETAISEVGRTITGAHVVKAKVKVPDTAYDVHVDLKSRRGLISVVSLGKFEEFGTPEAAVLAEDEQLDPAELANFIPEDEERFQAMYGVHNRKQISMHAGAFGVAPRQPGRTP